MPETFDDSLFAARQSACSVHNDTTMLADDATPTLIID